MKFRIFGFCFWLLAAFPAAAEYRGFSDEEIRAHTRVLDIHATSILNETAIALFGLSETFKRVNLSDKEGYELLGRTVDQLNNARAIIYIKADGMLSLDSFSYPAWPLSLSSREYFKETVNASEYEIVVGGTYIGKTSGIPFVPISTPVIRDGELQGVLVATITPNVLIAHQNPTSCLHCMSLLTDLSGEVITKYPESFKFDDDFKQKLNLNQKPASGTEIIQLEQLNARVYWIRNDRFPIISVFLEFIRN